MRKFFYLFAVSFWFVTSAFAQQKKYPSLFWEITGNGLQKPSYLFGTMHVSNKMVFHLSDSFYTAIQHVDVVALEQNPYYWQRDMMQMNEAQVALKNYMTNGANDYVNEKSFQLTKYEDNLRAALTDQPMQINGLLYRTSRVQEDYEENTYLDLYIYQTGRRLGKLAGGVENYYQSQQMVYDAYRAAAKDKVKKRPDATEESMYDIEKKIQDAYRAGDLDVLDSLEKFEYASSAFTEIFLYKRNEVQANSIDTILRHHSLFTGVGAAHLPGKRGVIELLRKKGYRLRPVFMTNNDADKKDAIDKLHVPVVFNKVSTADNFIQMQLPGPLFKRADSRLSLNDSWQYADMDNGAYYMLTRVKTHAAMQGQSPKAVLQKIDSLLYENIPGKILKKTAITINGYNGFDITNRTRRGDVQRYNIIVTPFEVLVFKMSGNEEYVSGGEANTFFKSIFIQKDQSREVMYKSAKGGFSVTLPQTPYVMVDKTGSDGIPAFECEATDSATGTAYMIWKKTVNNYNFLEEDTFDLSLVEESVKRSDCIDKEKSRSFSEQNGYAALLMQFALKNGNTMYAKAILRGAHYYLLAVSAKDNKYNPAKFFASFSFTDFAYDKPMLFSDTTMHYAVQTPVKPVLDTFIRKLVYEASGEDFLSGMKNYVSYRNKNKTAFFQDDSTGEAVMVNSITFPKYYFNTDTADFWNDQLDMDQYKGMMVKKKDTFTLANTSGYKILIGDTNTVRQVARMYILNQNTLYVLTALSDSVNKNSGFLSSFFNTFTTSDVAKSSAVFTDKTTLFFSDYKSKDSAAQKMAAGAISQMNFTCKALPQMKEVIAAAKYKNKNYFDDKASFIRELGYIKVSNCAANVSGYLSQLYHQTADTSYFQNEIMMALARLKTKNAYDSLKNLLLQDPPLFDNKNDYNTMFELLEDSLSLSKNLFPDLLQLASLEDYKEPVNNLLRQLVDSGFIKDTAYNSYFSRIYFDAKTELKKQQNKDEKTQQEQSSGNSEDNDDNNTMRYVKPGMYNQYYHQDYASDNDLVDYAALLAPFYKTNPAVPVFFAKLLQLHDAGIRLGAAVLLLRNNINVPDTIWRNLAASDKYRAVLYSKLADINKEKYFPENNFSQELIAKSLLLNDKNAEKFQACELVKKQKIKVNAAEKNVYFFKYKMTNDDDWKMGISGLQPADIKKINADAELVSMTGKKLNDKEAAAPQFEAELKKMLLSMHKSAARFVNNNAYSNYFNGDDGDN